METSFTLTQSQQFHNWHKENLIENATDVHNITHLYKTNPKISFGLGGVYFRVITLDSVSQILLQFSVIFDLKHFRIKGHSLCQGRLS